MCRVAGLVLCLDRMQIDYFGGMWRGVDRRGEDQQASRPKPGGRRLRHSWGMESLGKDGHGAGVLVGRVWERLPWPAIATAELMGGAARHYTPGGHTHLANCCAGLGWAALCVVRCVVASLAAAIGWRLMVGWAKQETGNYPRFGLLGVVLRAVVLGCCTLHPRQDGGFDARTSVDP